MTATSRPPGRLKHGLANQLQAIIESRGLTAYRLGKLTEDRFGADGRVNVAMISRFLAGTRDLKLSTVEQLGEVLGLRLVEVGTRRAASRKPRVPARKDGPGPAPGAN